MGTEYAFIAAFALSLIATPLARAFAHKVGALAQPGPRSVHRVPVAYLGGVAIYVSSVAGMLLAGDVDPAAMNALIYGGLTIVIVGVIDDIYDLKPWQKAVGQVISAGVVIALGVDINFFGNPFTGVLTNVGVLAIPVTMLWIVSFENLVNFSDGLDGLAAGISAITAVVIVIASYRAGVYSIPPAAAAIAGSVLGFLPFNFHPASIFMGDAGAMYLGLALSVLSVQGLVKSAAALSVIAPLLALLVPISDTAFAIVRRKAAGQSAAHADRDHLHHRLLEMGFGQTKAVLSIYAVTAAFGALGLVSAFIPPKTGAPIVGTAVVAVYVVASRAGLLTISRKESKGSARQSSGGQS